MRSHVVTTSTVHAEENDVTDRLNDRPELVTNNESTNGDTGDSSPMYRFPSRPPLAGAGIALLRPQFSLTEGER